MMKRTHINQWFKGGCVENVPAWVDENDNVFLDRHIVGQLMDLWLDWPKNRWAVRFDVMYPPNKHLQADPDSRRK
jgi:hypothetical protein